MTDESAGYKGLKQRRASLISKIKRRDKNKTRSGEFGVG
jgi:hypothetical protein